LLINHSIVIQCSALNVDMSFIFHKQHQNVKMQRELVMQTAPAQTNGKILLAGAVGGNWAGSPQSVALNNGHSFAKALEHVIQADVNNKFISYNNIPPDVPKVKTKSNSKGVLMMDVTDTDAAAWIVHTVPGFPKARTGYLFPPAEVQKGHLLICLTIKEDQIDTIAMTLRIATPLIYYNDIPDAQMNSRPNLRKLVFGESRILPPLAVMKDTSTATGPGLKVTIYSKGEKSRYVKVWTARDNKLKSDCRIPERNIRLVTSPISVNGDQSTLENDVSQWLVTETGNKFCAVDKPYQLVPTADLSAFFLYKHFLTKLFTIQNDSTVENYSVMNICTSDFQSWQYHPLGGGGRLQESAEKLYWCGAAILYKAPAKPNGKILHAGAANGNWANSPQPIARNNDHSFAKALEHVIAVNANNKFISYNNHPPDVPKVRTKSNSKGNEKCNSDMKQRSVQHIQHLGVLMMDTGNDDAAAWIVHTVPGFPKARTGYLFPPA
ncbi:Plancitoxin-1, partial [Trichinella sp. T9]